MQQGAGEGEGDQQDGGQLLEEKADGVNED